MTAVRSLAGRDALLGAILVTAAVYWLWFGITQRSITGDEGISLLAAQGVLEHGYPRLPSGFLYNRAYVPAYLLAGSIWLFGWNDLAIMLPGLVMALGSVWLTARLGGEVLGRPLVGLAAAALLVALQSQTFYATSARMYMPLQGFTVLAAYSAWRGFVRGEWRFQGVAGLAMAGAIFSHQQGGALLVAVPLAVLAVWRMQGPARAPVSKAVVLAGTLVLWAAFYVATLHEPTSRMITISAHSGADPDHAGLNLDVTRWLHHALVAESTVPLGILVVPWVVWLVGRALRAPRVSAHQGVVFTAGLFLLGGLAIAANIHRIHWRFWVMLLPLHVLLVSRGAAALVEWVSGAGAAGPSRRLRVRGLAGWALVVFAGSAAAFGPDVYAVQLAKAYGRPYCRTEACSGEVEVEHAKVRDALGPGDRVVSSNPMVTYYYLRRVDAFLRERLDRGRFVPFESAVDEYLGIPLIDEREELEALQRSDRRVWVVVDYKVRLNSSRAALEFVAGSFATFLDGQAITVYVNDSPFPPGPGRLAGEVDVEAP